MAGLVAVAGCVVRAVADGCGWIGVVRQLDWPFEPEWPFEQDWLFRPEWPTRGQNQRDDPPSRINVSGSSE